MCSLVVELVLSTLELLQIVPLDAVLAAKVDSRPDSDLKALAFSNPLGCVMVGVLCCLSSPRLAAGS